MPGVTHQVQRNGRNFPFVNTLRSQPNSGQVHGLSTTALVEMVDLMPTLAELVRMAVPPTCPDDSRHVDLCTEGASMVPVLKHAVNPATPLRWKGAAFSQFHRSHDGVDVMGFTMRTESHRYAEYVAWDTQRWQPDWSRVVGRELYDHSTDPEENHNLADKAATRHTVQQLSAQLRKGWRQYIH